MTPTIAQVIHHARNREYMSGIERDKARTKATGEGLEWLLHLLTLQRVSNIITILILTHFKYKL